MHRILVLAALFALILPTGASAAIERVIIQVDGLSCPFCAYTLEKKLTAVDGVAELAIDVADGTATLTPRKDETIDFAELPRAVKKAGFTSRVIRAGGEGRLDHEGETLLLVGENGHPLFRVEANDLSRQSYPDKDTLFSFDGIVGPADDTDQALPALSLTTLEPARTAKSH